MKVKVIKMANTNKRYEPEFKKKMVRLVLEEGRTIASVNKEYGLGEGTVRSWIRQFEEECEKNPETKEYILMPMIFKIKGKYPKEYLEKG